MNAKRLILALGTVILLLSACNMPRVRLPPWVETEEPGDATREIAENPGEAEPGETEPSEAANEPPPEEAPPPNSGAGEPPESGQGEAPPDTAGGDQSPPADIPDSSEAPAAPPPPTSTPTPSPTNTQPPPPPPPTATPTPTATNTPIPSGPDYTVYDDTAAMLARINAARTAQGLAPLSANGQLGNAALQHTIDMAVNNFMSHTGSNGSQPWDRVSAQGYSWSYVAENIAAGDSTVDGTFNQWWNSSGHRANMLSPDVTQMGLGHVSRPGTTYGHYWTLVLAHP
jgi:uncharacterized protein YkwD